MESRKKIADAGMGREPWNKGMAGFRAGSEHHYYGKTRSETERTNISKGRIGKGTGHNRPHTDETIEKIKSARALQIITEDHKKKIGDGNRGRAKPKTVCPYCNKEGGIPQMMQWHFDNCKSK